MKALLIYPLNKDEGSLIGLRKKMLSQHKSFSKVAEADLVCFGYNHIYFNDNILCDFKKYPKGFSFISFYIDFYLLILQNIDISSYDFIYIRYPQANPYFISFLKEVKNLIKNDNIFIEIPTFPYEKEAINIKRKLILFTDYLYRNKLKKYVKKIITHYGQKQIYGIDCFNMGNGVEYIDLTFKPDVKSNELKLIGVGNLSFYHGYDRLIKGLNTYYLNKNQSQPIIYFDIAGMGPEYLKLSSLVEKYKLENFIKFHGVKFDEDLQNLIDNSDIGISTLAWHRAGVNYDGSIKSREYAMQGLPFLSCADDLDFIDFKYRYIVGLKDKEIDIEKLIQFSNEIRKEEGFRNKIHKFALDNLTWDVKIKRFIEECIK